MRYPYDRLGRNSETMAKEASDLREAIKKFL